MEDRTTESSYFMKTSGNTDDPDPNDAVVVHKPVFDPIAFDVAMQKWRGFLREEMLAEGFNTTEKLMKDIRGR